MRLNTWQRLWIVSLVMWTLVIQALAYSAWPTTRSVQPDEIYARMPRSTKWVLRDAGEPDPLVPKEGPIIDVESHRVRFLAGVPNDNVTTAVNAYSAALREALLAKRFRDAQKWFAVWAGLRSRSILPAGRLAGRAAASPLASKADDKTRARDRRPPSAECDHESEVAPLKRSCRSRPRS
jgi:hypothetical protein